MPNPDRAKEPVATLHDCSGERWPDDVADAIKTTRRLKDARHVAVMPDVHLATGFCVGTVLATSRLIYPTAVGGDIGCGMLAVAFDADADAIDERAAARLLDALRKLVPANRHADGQLSGYTRRARMSSPRLDRILQRDGRVQLGTLGRGNHFLELQRDIADGRLWLMVHTGSRGLGQAISQAHLQSPSGTSHGKPYLDAGSNAGRAYLHDLRLARAYARLNRRRLAQATAHALHTLLGISTDPATALHTDHNHVQVEHIAGQRLWVHRKGAAPAHTGRATVVPGSMASPSFHVVGRGDDAALCSCAHGAGRRQDRNTARRTTSTQALRQQLTGVWFDQRTAGRLTDEAPSAYKDIRRVMKQQRRQVRILRELRPVLSYKGC